MNVTCSSSTNKDMIVAALFVPPQRSIPCRNQNYNDNAAVNTSQQMRNLRTHRNLDVPSVHSLISSDRKYWVILRVFNIICRQSQATHIRILDIQMQWWPCKEVTKHSFTSVKLAGTDDPAHISVVL
jgi:hypothetical protein